MTMSGDVIEDHGDLTTIVELPPMPTDDMFRPKIIIAASNNLEKMATKPYRPKVTILGLNVVSI